MYPRIVVVVVYDSVVLGLVIFPALRDASVAIAQFIFSYTSVALARSCVVENSFLVITCGI